MTTETVQILTSDNRAVSAALARAADPSAPALILIHEWWGLIDETRAMAEQLASRGFTTLAVDLYGGRTTLDAAVAGELMNAVDPAQAGATLAAWAAWLRGKGAAKVGTLGFCFGGTWSMNISLATPIDATVIFYGWVVRPPEVLKTLSGPVLAHFGSEDPVVPQDSADKLRAALAEAGKPGEVYAYQAGHAFARVGGPSYDPAASALAWQRTDAFLRKHLGASADAAVALPPSRQASFSEIPVLSIEALGRGDAAEAALIGQIRKASEEVGFFYVKDHGVGAELVEGIFEQCRRFFALPKAEREALRITNSKVFAGYLSVGELGANQSRPRDLLEAFNVCTELGVDDPYVKQGKPLYGANQWPASLPALKETVLAYYDAMDHLGRRLLQAFAMALDLPREALDHQYGKPISQLRLLNYPAQESAMEEMLGARPHRDTGMFTILLQDDAGGLEVGNASGEWIVAPPIDGTFVVNVGEMMKLLTNNHFASALHRVVNRSGRQRFSVPFFYNPDYETRLATLPQFDSAERPTPFKPIHVGEHMFNFYRNLWPSAPGGTAA
jgi:isopenicillin N synthase-like dioxygenase/dienelactone hydrolase